MQRKNREEPEVTPQAKEIITKIKLAMDLFRRTGVLHDVLAEQLKHLCRFYLLDQISRLDRLELDYDLEDPDYPRKVIFIVNSPSKTIKCPPLLKKFTKYLLGEEFKVMVKVEKKP